MLLSKPIKVLIFLVLLTFVFLFLQAKSAFASTLYLSPASGKIQQGQTLSVQVRLNTGGDSVNAVSAFVSYPADKLDVAWVSTNGSAFAIEAEKTYGGGSVKISRGNVNPVSGNVTVATIGFRGKALGNAAISFVAGSAAPRASDSSDSLNLGGSGKGSYEVVKAEPKKEEPKDTTAPKISGLSVTSITKNSAVVTWKTDEKANSFVEYGLEQGKYFLSVTKDDMETDHSLKLESAILTPGAKIHFRVKSKDAAGNETVGENTPLQLIGYQVYVKVLDEKGTPLANTDVFLYSEPLTAKTNDEGVAVFENVTLGKHVVIVATAEKKETSEIDVTDSDTPQNFEVAFSAPAKKAEEFGINPLYLGIIILLLVGLAVAVGPFAWKWWKNRQQKDSNATY
jgi:hypothetical protein